MINTDYSSIYSQYLRAGTMGRYKGMDKSHMSKNMEYLENARAEAEKAKGNTTKDATSSEEKRSGRKDVTQEGLRKIYAMMNGTYYGNDDGVESYRSMANTFLNEMVFSNMGSSKELFVPQISRNVISAAFRTAYDYSDVEEKLRQMKETEKTDQDDESADASKAE